MDEYVAKLEEELNDLNEKISKLDSFMAKVSRGDLEATELKCPFRVLAAQRDAMRMYHDALMERITIAKFS